MPFPNRWTPPRTRWYDPTMLNPSKVARIVSDAVSVASPLRIVQFGSSLTCKRRPGDLDLLVIIPDDRSPRETAALLNTRVRRNGVPCDFVVVREREARELRNDDWCVVSIALREGIVAYESGAVDGGDSDGKSL